MERKNMYKNEIPQFDGQKYALWSIMMKTYVHAQGFEVWKSFVDGYKEPTILPTNNNGKKLNLNNSKSTNALLTGLCDSIYTEVIHCRSAKEIWDKLQNIYEGDSKVKATNLQTYKGQFK
jgi:hypothetical protein